MDQVRDRYDLAPAFDVPVGREQVQQVLHGLLEAGRRSFRGVVRQLERETDFQPSPTLANDVREIAAQAGVLRRSLAQTGWLQEEGRPAHGLPAAAVPPGEVWTASQAQRLFKRGDASGRGNACWFDSFRQQGEGLGLSALQSVGSPDDPAVYLHCDDTHFVPMWRRPDEPGAGAPA